MVSVAEAAPAGPFTVIFTAVLPAALSDPERMPVFSSSVRPAGRFSAAKVSGPSPVAGMRNRNGRPGVAPTMRG